MKTKAHLPQAPFPQPETLEQRLRRDLDAWIAAKELIERARRQAPRR